MKRINLIIPALVFISSAVFSQGQLDAYKYAQTDLGGTARYQAMGGAFGALGGDISVMGANPAGLSVYRSSEMVATISHKVIATNTTGPTATGSSARFNFDNIAYVGYFPSSADAGILGWNVGFSYNRLKDYYRNYTSLGMGDQNYSLSDYIAERANVKGRHKDDLSHGNGYDPYASSNNNDWLSVLGYDAVFIDAMDVGNRYISAFGDNINGTMHPYPLAGRELNVKERGAIDQYNMAFGLNISDIALLGASLAITDISYHYNSYFAEDFANKNYLELENWLRTEGTGYALNIGAILRPVNFLRLGVAYNSPTWYKMTDRYQATANSETNYWNEPRFDIRTPEGITEYRYRSPDKWLFSAALIIGRMALLSVDYERTNYKNMKMYNWEGIEDRITNDEVTTNFTSAATLRIGGEVKLTPRFAIRAGAARIGNPMSSVLRDATSEVYTVGTIPHYTTEKSITNYTFGLGYRFTSNFYMDAACVLKAQEENLYTFSKIYAGNQLIINSTPTVLKTNTTHVALTLGYKF
ncbi:MAG: outer membrane protein transport protein [Tannerellaceae bacterium]|nr:outer membrane protein transport protein [Tannerellaceae bacterium]